MGGSWQLRVVDSAVRQFIRRERWGDEAALVRRARRLFGAPSFWGEVAARGLVIRRVEEDGARGEWVEPAKSERGVIMYIHGGGYVSCSSQTHRPISTALARLGGRKVFSVDYRRAPEHRFPAAFDDVVSTYKWLLAADGGIAEPIAVAGDSAGGGLVLALLLAIRDANLTRPSCAVLASPWTDLTGSGESLRSNAGRCSMFRPRNIADFATAYLGRASAVDSRASPLFADLSGLPPMLLQVGDTDLLLDDARRVHEKVMAAGGESIFEAWPYVFHGWQMLDGLVPEARAALERAADFITLHMRNNTQ